MNILFHCFTTYQIFIAYLLSVNKYKDQYKIIAVSDINDSVCSIIDNVREIGVWDDVIVIHEKNRSEKSIEKQVLELIDNLDVDIYHFFSYGDYASRVLINNIREDIYTIFTEEGRLTYRPLTDYEHWKRHRFGNDPKKWQEINWKKIDEILVFEPKLFDHSMKIKVTRLEIEDFVNDALKNSSTIDELNKLYNYEHFSFDSEIVYFDNYFSANGIWPLDYERYYIERLFDVLDINKMIIKLHPGERNNFHLKRYDGYKPKFFDNSIVPWEVVYLNILKKEKRKKIILVSPSSTAIYNSLIFSNCCNHEGTHIIALHNIVTDYCNQSILEPDKEYAEKFREIYGRERVFVPDSWTELHEMIKKIYNESKCELLTFEDRYILELKNELHWLRKLYLNKSGGNFKELFERNRQYYLLLNSWLELKQKGIELFEYFCRANYSSIAIYGNGEIAKRLTAELKNTEIKIKCYMVSNSQYEKTNNDIELISLENVNEYLERNHIDAVVITPVYDHENIKRCLLNKGVNCSILSLDKIINELLF